MKCVVFDLDGTLITCAERQQTVLRVASDPLRDQIDVCDIWLRKRRGLSTQAALEAAGVNPIRSREIATKWRLLVEEPVFLQIDQCFADTLPCLERLQAKTYELILLTARSRPWFVPAQLRRLRLSHYFRKVLIVAPEHAAHQKAQELLSLHAEAFIGDTETDMTAAALSGTPFFTLATGQRDPEFLAQQGASRVYRTLEELELLNP